MFERTHPCCIRPCYTPVEKYFCVSRGMSVYLRKLYDMTRQEFSEKLCEVKKEMKMPLPEMVYSLRMLVHQIRRIEKAQHNYALAKAISYLQVLNHHIEVTVGSSKTKIYTTDDAVQWFRIVKGDESANELAPKINVSSSTVNFILSGERGIAIDVFLSICNHYNAIVGFAKNERTKRP